MRQWWVSITSAIVLISDQLTTGQLTIDTSIDQKLGKWLIVKNFLSKMAKIIRILAYIEQFLYEEFYIVSFVLETIENAKFVCISTDGWIL